MQYYCDQNHDRRILVTDYRKFSTFTLRSAPIGSLPVSNRRCHTMILGTDINIKGFIITVQSLSLTNSNSDNNNNGCEDHIVIDNQYKWCQTSDSTKSLTKFLDNNNNHLTVEFNTGSNSTAEFEFTITAFSGVWNHTCPKPGDTIRCDGGQQLCIYNGLECDGRANCPNGSDEHDCPILLLLNNTNNSDDDYDNNDLVDYSLYDNNNQSNMSSTNI
ncbi:uncharacterized protein LOC128951554 [Oppia nitens]|uniref:uncharacterized protein LOC128951554 n=1 Tax=Oppia nitens TaxID=1686743 RepID=UPI0023DBFEAB|nr:uncharacterized protein LOC128951554 [Oppia nitens]